MNTKSPFADICTFSAVVGVSVVLFGCTVFDPFVDARREAGQAASVGSSSKDRPVICYGFAEPEEIDALAQNECAKTNRVAVFDYKEDFKCALFAPQKAVYRCEKSDKPVALYQSECALKSK